MQSSSVKCFVLTLFFTFFKEYSDLRPLIISDFYKWLKRRKIKSFYTEVTSTSLRAGVSALMQVKYQTKSNKKFEFILFGSILFV